MNVATRSFIKEFVEIFCRCYSRNNLGSRQSADSSNQENNALWICYTGLCSAVAVSIQKKNHYEVLKVKKNCSSRDIKDAFIKMSKEFHPDKNKNVNAQEHFVQIVEAYNVLSKPSSRASYDSSMSGYSSSLHSSQRNTAYAKPRHYHSYKDYYDQYTTGHAYSQAEHQQRANQDYFYRQQQAGPRQQQSQKSTAESRILSKYLVFTCIGFAIFGILLEVFVIRYSFSYNKRKAEEKSKLIAEEYKKIRAAAIQNGNEVQTRLLLEKIAVGSNPSVATASLGHALASEKKDPTESILAQIGILSLIDEDAQSQFAHDEVQ